MNTDLKAFKQQLPLARIKKIMKSDQDVRVCTVVMIALCFYLLLLCVAFIDRASFTPKPNGFLS